MQLPNISELLATSDARAISKGMETLVAVRYGETEDSVFQARAAVLFETVTPVLVWLRDHKGVAPTVTVLRSTMQLRTMWMLATRRVFCLPQDEAGEVVEILVNDMPESIVVAIRDYLEFMLGLDLTCPEHNHGFDEADRRHGFALMYYTSIFGELLPRESGQP